MEEEMAETMARKSAGTRVLRINNLRSKQQGL
jgi:hypothetical protein